MAQYDIGDTVTLKDDGQSYKVVAVRIEDHMVLYDLQMGDERASLKLTVLQSQIEIPKVYAPKYPKTTIYKKKD